jgi:SagB-type dehydrogenase family enzyme
MCYFENDSEHHIAFYSQTAAAFHRVTCFGHFPEPEPPYSFPQNKLNELGGSCFEHDTVRGRASLLLGAIDRRRSQRTYGPESIPRTYLGSLLWAAYGKRTANDEVSSRVIPSAGACYPLSVYALVLSVTDTIRGFYEYQPDTDTLIYLPEILVPLKVNDWFRTTHIDYKGAAAILFIIGHWQKICPKYGSRGYRYLLLEAGHMAQNLSLLATTLDVPHVPVGGFNDDVVNSAFHLDSEKEGVVYSIVIGQMFERRGSE